MHGRIPPDLRAYLARIFKLVDTNFKYMYVLAIYFNQFQSLSDSQNKNCFQDTITQDASPFWDVFSWVLN